MKFFILITISLSIWAQFKSQNYQNARNQNILEYTVFGIDECIKGHQDKLVVTDEELLADQEKVVIGSQNYFQLLANCFNELSKNCTSDNCIVSKSMGKRIENVKYLDLMMSKYKDEKLLSKSLIKE